MGRLLQMTDELLLLLPGCDEMWLQNYIRFFNIYIYIEMKCISSSAVTVNPQQAEFESEGGVHYVCRENLGQWEKISRGEVEDVVPSRPYDSGPVKVDN